MKHLRIIKNLAPAYLCSPICSSTQNVILLLACLVFLTASCSQSETAAPAGPAGVPGPVGFRDIKADSNLSTPESERATASSCSKSDPQYMLCRYEESKKATAGAIASADYWRCRKPLPVKVVDVTIFKYRYTGPKPPHALVCEVHINNKVESFAHNIPEFCTGENNNTPKIDSLIEAKRTYEEQGYICQPLAPGQTQPLSPPPVAAPALPPAA